MLIQKSTREPIKSQLPILSYAPNHLILPGVGWGSQCLGNGNVWQSKFILGVDVFVTSECIHLYILDCISLYPDGDVCSSNWESH